MIEVRVGKKHEVDLGEVANGQCGRGQAFRSDCKTGQSDSDPRKVMSDSRAAQVAMESD